MILACRSEAEPDADLTSPRDGTRPQHPHFEKIRQAAVSRRVSGDERDGIVEGGAVGDVEELSQHLERAIGPDTHRVCRARVELEEPWTVGAIAFPGVVNREGVRTAAAVSAGGHEVEQNTVPVRVGARVDDAERETAPRPRDAADREPAGSRHTCAPAHDEVVATVEVGWSVVLVEPQL